MSENYNKNHTLGYTILEVIIAIFVIVTGVFSILTLVVSSLSNTTQALDYLVAANLAREGIELVRNQRDTNWYKNNDFDYGLTDATEYTAIVDYDDIDASNDIIFNFIADDIDDPTCQLYRSNGVYTRDIGNATKYHRLIYLNDICQDISADPIVPGNESVKNNGASCGAETKIGIDIISKVEWLDKNGNPKIVELNNRIYDWR